MHEKNTFPNMYLSTNSKLEENFYVDENASSRRSDVTVKRNLIDIVHFKLEQFSLLLHLRLNELIHFSISDIRPKGVYNIRFYIIMNPKSVNDPMCNMFLSVKISSCLKEHTYSFINFNILVHLNRNYFQQFPV